MAKSMFDELIGEQEIDFNCPHCDKELSISVNQIGTTIKCPYCSYNIELQEEGDGLSSARKVTDEFEETLNKLSE